MKWQTPSLGWICLAAAPAAQVMALDEVQVAASRLPMAVQAAPHEVTVLPATLLQRHMDLATAVSTVAGAFVQRPGGRSGVAALYLDGADPNFTTVLLDGVALNNPADTRGGAVNLSGLEAGTFSRAELAAGPYSSIHGSGALAGALNLVVPAGLPEPTLRGELDVGEQGVGHAALMLRTPLAAGLGASLSTDLVDDGSGHGGSRYRAEALTLKIAPLDDAGNTERGSLLLRTRESRSEAFPDASGGDRYATLRTLEQRRNRQSLGAAVLPFQLGLHTRVQLRASWLQEASDTVSPGVAASAQDPFGIPSGNDETRYERHGLQGQASHQAGRLSLLWGAERQWERGSSNGALDFGGFSVPSRFALARSTTAAYAEALWTGSRWSLAGSSRLDKVEGLPSQLTANGTLRHDIPDSGLTLRLSAGSAFKAPSLYALGNPFVGNPDLRPESARSWRASAQWSGKQGSEAVLTLFRAEYSGLVDFIPGPPPRLENRAAVLSRGANLRLRQEFGPVWSANAFLQWATTYDRDSGTRLLDRPGTRVGGIVEWQPHKRFQATAQYLHLGERRSYSIPTGVMHLNATGELSLQASWQATERYALRLAVDNTLDDAPEHAVGFTPTARRIRAGFTGTL